MLMYVHDYLTITVYYFMMILYLGMIKNIYLKQDYSSFITNHILRK